MGREPPPPLSTSVLSVSLWFNRLSPDFAAPNWRVCGWRKAFVSSRLLMQLNAQQELVSARIALVQAQRDRLVNSYGVLAAVGRLSPQVLGLRVQTYDPGVHYHQVRDAWTGVRTPDGR